MGGTAAGTSWRYPITAGMLSSDYLQLELSEPYAATLCAAGSGCACFNATQRTLQPIEIDWNVIPMTNPN